MEYQNNASIPETRVTFTYQYFYEADKDDPLQVG